MKVNQGGEVSRRLRDSARALLRLGSVEDLLAFPATYVSKRTGRLRSIAQYTNGALMPWEPEWGQDLRRVGIREVAQVVIKSLSGDGAQWTWGNIPEEHQSIVKRQVLLYEAVCGVNYGCSMRMLWIEIGNKNESALLKLVQLDKSTVTLPFVRGWIKRCQHLGEWAFFERLGKAMAASPLNAPPYMYGAVLLTAGFWDEYFSGLSYSETVRFLENEGILPGGKIDPKSFAQMMKRRGLRKTKHSRYKSPETSATFEAVRLSQS